MVDAYFGKHAYLGGWVNKGRRRSRDTKYSTPPGGGRRQCRSSGWNRLWWGRLGGCTSVVIG
jgi:hypothetical protein